MDNIKVISADLDGAQLRREKHKNPCYTRCAGRRADGDINEAINHVGKIRISIPPDRWEAIFGGAK